MELLRLRSFEFHDWRECFVRGLFLGVEFRVSGLVWDFEGKTLVYV